MAHQLLNSHQSCTTRCRSKQHVTLLTNALGKAPPEQVKTYCLLKCKNLWRQTDEGGRSLVHWSASKGQAEILKWLVEELKADFSGKDIESGYTPLHRALLYGQIRSAQLLLECGASTAVLDHEGLTAFDLLHKDQNTGRFLINDPVELYTYGENMSYNLGHAHPTPRMVPEPVDFFRRQAISITKVSMSKFHSLFLSRNGQVFSCGHGLGGRLGLGSEEPQFRPRLIPYFKEAIWDIAAATDHSLFIDQAGFAYSCGTNSYKQLGIGSVIEKVLEPQTILMQKTFKRNFVACRAGTYHSILWTGDWNLYTFGLNAGQIGHTKAEGPYIAQPKKVTFFGAVSNSSAGAGDTENRIFVDISCSDAALVIATGFQSGNKSEGAVTTKRAGETWLVYKFDKLRIATKQLETKSVHVIGGRLECAVEGRENCCEPLRVVILTKSGKVQNWHEDDRVLRRCVFAGSRHIYPSALTLNNKGIVIVLEDGRAFKGAFGRLRKEWVNANVHNQGQLRDFVATASGKEKKSKEVSGPLSWRSKILGDEVTTFLEENECQSISLNRVPGVHRGILAFSDPGGKNFALIQQIPSRDLTEIPVIRPRELASDMERLLLESDIGDSIHDLVIICKGKRYPLHKFVLFSRATAMKALISENSGSAECEWNVPAWLEDMNPLIFEEFLKFVYTDDSALLRAGTRWGEDGVVGKQLPMKEQNGVVEGEVISLGNRKRNKKSKQKDFEGHKEKQQGKKELVKNPLRQLQDIARRFGVKSLTKKIDCLRWEFSDGDIFGTIREMKQKVLTTPRVRFETGTMPELCDVQLNCQDGVHFKCHRCMLSGRMEYFRCMLGNEWLEGKRRSGGSVKEPISLFLPFNSDVVRLLLFYVYTDELPPSVRRLGDSCDVPEVLCRLLVSADQLLVERLREICEASIAETISLRNATELLQFSLAYNASGLRNTCLQFICLNLASFLDCDGLQGLDDDCLYAVGCFYREMYQHVAARRLTPSSENPSIEDIQLAYSKLLSSSLTVEQLTSFVFQEQQNTEMHNNSATTSPRECHAKKSKQAACSLRKKTFPAHSDQFALPVTPGASPDHSFEMGAEEKGKGDFDRTEKFLCHGVPQNLNGIDEGIKKNVEDGKFPEEEKEKDGLETYFQRKRRERQLLMKDGESVGSNSGPGCKENEGSLPKLAWCLTPESPSENVKETENTVVSLAEVMAAEECAQKIKMIEDEERNRSVQVKRVLFDSAKKSRFSWGKIEEEHVSVKVFDAGFSDKSGTVRASSPKRDVDFEKKNKMCFKDIVKEEEGKLAEKERLQTKPLSVIQMEEQAMEELLKAYGAAENLDEVITVERVSGSQIAEPIWKALV